MFDNSDRLALYSNILSAALGVFLVIFTDLLFSGIILIISALALNYLQIRLNQTPFTIYHLDRTVTMQDNGGSKAVETQNHAITTNHSGLSEFWCRNINSNGFVSHVTINGAPPAETLKEDSNTHASIKFDGNLKTGQPLELVVSFNHNNAFTDTHCILSHTVDNETKLLRLVVKLPEGRPVTSARVFRKVDDVETPLLPPFIAENGNVVADIKDPLIGATYYLQWDCPKLSFADKIDRIFK